MVSIQQIEVGYPGKGGMQQVLSGINLQAEKNELVAMVGRNGAGKTTLMKAMVGLHTPLGGSIFLDGKDLVHLGRKELSRMISYLSTDLIHSPSMTVYDLVALGRYPYTRWLGLLEPADKEWIDKAMEYTHVSSFARKSLNDLSDGERQRAMIARALAQDTPLMVMDEPAAFLDVVNRYEIMMMLRKMCREEGKTVIVSTHDLSMAIHEADKVWLLNQGGAVQGAPEDLILQGMFRNLFQGSRVSVDDQSGAIQLQHPFMGNASLEGEGMETEWTRKALDRCGFRISNHEPLFRVIVKTDGEGCYWKFQKNGEELMFRNIYELTLLIRNKFH